jgi:hypothetical protein
MRKIAMLVALCGFAIVVPAQADKPPHPLKPNKQNKPHKPNPHKCVAHAEGYNASGTLVLALLTKQPDGRYNGTIRVIVTRANHKAATGDQTFTLTDARVKFHHGVDPANLAANSRVGLHGKITQLPHSCSSLGFTPVITVKKVDIRKPAKP